MTNKARYGISFLSSLVCLLSITFTVPGAASTGIGMLRSGFDPALCLDAGAYSSGAEVTLQNCDQARSQQFWQFDSEGRIALAADDAYCLHAFYRGWQ